MGYFAMQYVYIDQDALPLHVVVHSQSQSTDENSRWCRQKLCRAAFSFAQSPVCYTLYVGSTNSVFSQEPSQRAPSATPTVAASRGTRRNQRVNARAHYPPRTWSVLLLPLSHQLGQIDVGGWGRKQRKLFGRQWQLAPTTLCAPHTRALALQTPARLGLSPEVGVGTHNN